MPVSMRRRLRLARRGLWYLTAVSLVLMALGAAILSQLLPLAERHPDRIAEWLSARAGRPVRFDRLDTEWTRRGPLLRLDGLRVGEGAGAVSIGAAEILVSQYAGLLPGRSFTELRVRHLALTLERADDGSWRVRGLPGQAQGGDPLGALEGLGELQVIDARLGISAPSLGIDTTVPHVDVRLQVNGPRVRSGLRARMRADAAPVDFVLDFDRVRGDGRLYATGRELRLADWSSLLKIGGVDVVGGAGRAEVWATLRHRQVSAIAVDGDLRRLRLRGAALADDAGGARAVAEFAQLTTVAHWRVRDGDWRLDASRLQIHADASSRPQVLDGLAIAGGRHYGLRAERIDAGPLFAVAALSDRLSPKLRRWLQAAHPGAVLEAVQVAGERGGAMRATARVRGLGFAPVANTPGLSDLAGTLRGDGDGFAFAFDPAAKLRFDWPTGFGPTHVVGLRGEAVAWRDEAGGWRVETPGLRIDGDGYGADLRGGLWFQGDGSRPWLGIAADLDDAQAPVAKRFWPKFAMSPALVRWLDTALIAGRVRDGRAVVAGELEDWPFKSIAGAPPKGVFDARATLQDMRVKFQDEWPATADMDADIAFVDNGFSVNGKAVLGEVGIRAFDAGIPDYGAGLLGIHAHADADAAKLLALLRQSPLRREHGKVLSTLSADGPVAADFGLELPLHGPLPHRPKIAGSIELRGARLAESEWKLAFSGVTGKARYDENGFSADGLRAQYDRQDGKLSLRAGAGHVRDRRQGFEAELEASMTSDDLLARVPDLAWLRPHLRGRSRWTAGIAIPAGAGPAAGANATARGMGPWMRMLLNGGTLDGRTILTPEAFAQMAAISFRDSPVSGGVAHGFLSRRYGALISLEHDGSGLYFHSSMVAWPQAGLAIFVAVNTDSGAPLANALPTLFIEHFVAAARPAAPETLEPGPAIRDAIAGAYVIERRNQSTFEGFLQRSIDVTRLTPRADGTVMLTTGSGTFRYVFEGPEVLRALESGARIQILKNADGTVYGYSSSSGVNRGRKLGTIDTPMVLQASAAALLALSFWVLIARLVRLRFGHMRGQGWGERIASVVQGLAALAWLTAAVLLMMAVMPLFDTDVAVFDYPSPFLREAQMALHVAAGLSLFLVPMLFLAWTGPKWRLRRVTFTLYALLAVAVVGLLWRWGALLTPLGVGV